MTQYGMGDDATIDEVLEDVDTDKVNSHLLESKPLICFLYRSISIELNSVI